MNTFICPGFVKKIEVPTVYNRPATWPRSKTGSPDVPRSANKPRPSNANKGADIRNVARLIVDKYKQEETIPSYSKDAAISKQVPLWLLNQAGVFNIVYIYLY